jgi:hypothetical protein
VQSTSGAVIGAIFVFISAVGRFNTPASNRYSTTALRYYLSAFCYVALGLGLYVGLLQSPEVADELLHDGGYLSTWASKLSLAPLAALMLTVLLPKVPLLAEADAWIRERLQELAAIPHEARRIAAELRNARFSISPHLRAEVTRRLSNEGFPSDDVLFEESKAFEHTWTKVSALMVQLEEWNTDRKFVSFVAKFTADFDDLKKRHQRLAPKIRLLQGMSPVGGDSKSDRLLLEFRAELDEQSTDMLNGIYNFISRGLLQCGMTFGARAARVAMLGFDLRTVSLKPRLGLHQLMSLFGMIGAVLLAGFTLVNSSTPASFGELLERATMISIIYSVAVICAVYPKERWKLARRGLHRPTGFYFAAAILATAASLGISLGFQVMIFHKLDQALLHFRLGAPWAACSFVTAFMVAWMTDDEPKAWLSRRNLRRLESLAGAGALMLTSAIVLNWQTQVAMRLEKPQQPHLPPPLLVAVGLGATIGFVIAYLIPTWYREAPREEDLRGDVALASQLQPASPGL